MANHHQDRAPDGLRSTDFSPSSGNHGDNRTPASQAPTAQTTMNCPKDALIVMEILKSMKVEKYEPRVVNQLLDFSHRYMRQVLSDAKSYSEFAAKSAIDLDDVKLSVQTKVNFSFAPPPPREFLHELARACNSEPLPIAPVPPTLFPLPPEPDCLLNPDFQIALPEPTAAGLPPVNPSSASLSSKDRMKAAGIHAVDLLSSDSTKKKKEKKKRKAEETFTEAVQGEKKATKDKKPSTSSTATASGAATGAVAPTQPIKVESVL